MLGEIRKNIGRIEKANHRDAHRNVDRVGVGRIAAAAVCTLAECSKQLSLKIARFARQFA